VLECARCETRVLSRLVCVECAMTDASIAFSISLAFANLASSGANLAALGLAAHGGDVGAPMAKETKGRSGAKRAGKAPPTKKAPAAKRAKAPAKAAPKAKAPVTKGKKPASAATSGTIKQAKSMTETTDDEGDYSDDGDSRDEEGNTLGGSDVRRQRRMLSNRESARRSRRRKLEHVAQLEGQIAQINAELALSMQKCRQLELRTAELVRENTTFKAENQRYLQLLQQAGPPGANVTAPKAGSSMERKSSLQRISSNGDLTKRLDSPTIGTGTGFVPFRSLQSYENLLALQAQATQGSGRTS